MNAAQNATAVAPAPPAADLPQELDFSNRLSDEQANTIYTAGYQLTRKGDHERASALFGLLGMYRPHEPMYAHAVAVCFRKLGRYKEAIPLFARTMELRPDDYGPAFQLIECLMLLKEHDKALGLLEIIAGVARDEGKTETLERAVALTELIQAGMK
jgi:tetratricopeptide (TPR) repeat protein